MTADEAILLAQQLESLDASKRDELLAFIEKVTRERDEYKKLAGRARRPTRN